MNQGNDEIDAEQLDEESQCGRPCDPNNPCEECRGYWQFMVAEGYWDRERHRWTDKGWAQITRSI